MYFFILRELEIKPSREYEYIMKHIAYCPSRSILLNREFLNLESVQRWLLSPLKVCTQNDIQISMGILSLQVRNVVLDAFAKELETRYVMAVQTLDILYLYIIAYNDMF